MNGLSKPGDYPLLSLRGREFIRLSPQAVETFWIMPCKECGAATKTNAIIVSESSDDRLIREGLHLFLETPPLASIQIHEHAELWCQDCYIKWLKPSEAQDHE